MLRINKILSEKCPRCEEGDVFLKKGNVLLFQLPKMKHKCDKCNHIFEREPGYFTGAMYVSYGMVVAEMIFIYLIAQFFISTIEYIVPIFILAILLFSFSNFRLSRVIWMYLFTKKKV